MVPGSSIGTWGHLPEGDGKEGRGSTGPPTGASECAGAGNSLGEGTGRWEKLTVEAGLIRFGDPPKGLVRTPRPIHNASLG